MITFVNRDWDFTKIDVTEKGVIRIEFSFLNLRFLSYLLQQEYWLLEPKIILIVGLKIKLTRGEICVANFIPPCKWLAIFVLKI